MKLFDKTVDLIERSMDLHFKRHAVLSSNVANSETPNYRAREIDFAGELARIIKSESNSTAQKTSPLHMDLAAEEGAHIVFDEKGAVGADGNNVDLDIAMGKLSTNASAYSGAVSLLGVQLRLIKNATRGRSS